MNPRPLPAIRDQPAPVMVGRARSSETPTLPEEQAGPDWRRIASALLRFKWIVILMVTLGLGGAVAATRVLRPIYRAQANVWVDVPDRRGEVGSDARGPIRQGALLDADAWVELLRSYVVLDEVVRDLSLYLDVKRPSDRPTFEGFHVRDNFRPGNYRLSVGADGREYRLASAEDVELERGAVGDSVGRRLGFRWVPAPGTLPPGRTVEFSVVAPRDAALRLGEARRRLATPFARVFSTWRSSATNCTETATRLSACRHKGEAIQGCRRRRCPPSGRCSVHRSCRMPSGN